MDSVGAVHAGAQAPIGQRFLSPGCALTVDCRCTRADHGGSDLQHHDRPCPGLSRSFALCLRDCCALPMASRNPAPNSRQELRAKEAAAKKDPDAAVRRRASGRRRSRMARRREADLPGGAEDQGGPRRRQRPRWATSWSRASGCPRRRPRASAPEGAGAAELRRQGLRRGERRVGREGARPRTRSAASSTTRSETVTKDEMLALQAGKVRHPETGETDRSRSISSRPKKKYYPVGAQGPLGRREGGRHVAQRH
jgi:hypothetical protein